MDEKESTGLNKLFEELGKNKKAARIVVVLGLAGMLLILISEFIGGNKSAAANKSPPESIAAFPRQTYILELEEKILSMLQSVKGVGKAKVMVTLKTAGEYVYARDISLKTESGEGHASGSENRSDSLSRDEKYIYIEDENSRKKALLLAELLPEIKGVVVVCEGGDKASVKSDIINMLTTGLGIYANNVYIAKLSG
ncbi:MAG: hypothetical protein LBC56_06000 [Oscillospiraceae bacterium]|jgi:stage III sporulation protein AG|nr:hypothetical protein [Oscillospiraceae bacterium]